MNEIYNVDPWNAAYRDRPPLFEPGFENPLRLAPGDVIRTTCNWRSTANVDLGFPAEMCASVLWIYPATEPMTCSGTVAP
jgi:hypothetical protein